MIDKTLEQLVTEIQTELHQVAGPSVQIYSQDMLVNRINDAFITFFDDPEVIWDRFMQAKVFTLDGVTGTATEDVSDYFISYSHIMRVYPENSDRALVAMNRHRNPALITGTAPVFIRAYRSPNPAFSTKIFLIQPVTATGDVVVWGKNLPDTGYPFTDLETVVPFDYLAIKYYVAWQELVDDGANPAATERALKLFQNRYDTLKKNESQEPIAYNGGSSAYPTEWYDPYA